MEKELKFIRQLIAYIFILTFIGALIGYCITSCDKSKLEDEKKGCLKERDLRECIFIYGRK